MKSDEFDANGFQRSIVLARDNVHLAAQAVAALSKREDWPGHRAGVELVFYLAQLDYEIKVLINQLFTDPLNRAVWEKYLALELHEALETVPQVLGSMQRSISLPSSPSHLDLSTVSQAARAYRDAIKLIKADRKFVQALVTIRNSVAAHHKGKGGVGLDGNIAWMMTSLRNESAKASPFDSQIAEYAVALGRAIQDLANTISGNPAVPQA